MFSSLLHVTRSLGVNRRLVFDFVRRDMRSRYAGASLGLLWSVLFPVINMFVYMFVFQLILKARWGDKMTPPEVTLLMLTGIVVWMSFAETLQRATTCVMENSNLIQKVVFPAEVLPTYISISSVVNMVFGIPIVVLGMFAVVNFYDNYLIMRTAVLADGGEVGPLMGLGVGYLALPLLFALQLVFSLGLAFFLATFNVLVRDIAHVMGVVLTVWMFSTPIFYPAQKVLDEGFGFLLYNPMYWLIDSYRTVLLYGLWPDWQLVGQFALVALLVFAFGAHVLRKYKPQFPDLL